MGNRGRHEPFRQAEFPSGPASDHAAGAGRGGLLRRSKPVLAGPPGCFCRPPARRPCWRPWLRPVISGPCIAAQFGAGAGRRPGARSACRADAPRHRAQAGNMRGRGRKAEQRTARGAARHQPAGDRQAPQSQPGPRDQDRPGRDLSRPAVPGRPGPRASGGPSPGPCRGRSLARPRRSHGQARHLRREEPSRPRQGGGPIGRSFAQLNADGFAWGGQPALQMRRHCLHCAGKRP